MWHMLQPLMWTDFSNLRTSCVYKGGAAGCAATCPSPPPRRYRTGRVIPPDLRRRFDGGHALGSAAFGEASAIDSPPKHREAANRDDVF